jgi:hypothetical protein
MLLRLSDLIFRHQSPRYYDVLRPVTYRELISFGRDPRYVEDRQRFERKYRWALGQSDDTSESFLYATAVGFHRMESWRTYPGFTYYFRMTREQLQASVCHVVDQTHSTKPLPGVNGLQSALNTWARWESSMLPRYDSMLGHEDPRVEVVIGCEIAYDRFVTQTEDRLVEPSGGPRMNMTGDWFKNHSS